MRVVAPGDGAGDLAETLYTLEEPWRGRFLHLVAGLATGGQWNGRPPEREDVSAWLRCDPGLRQTVRRLLAAWVRPEA